MARQHVLSLLSSLLLDQFPKLPTKHPYPRLWLIVALTQYWFNNRRAGKLKKKRKQEKESEASEPKTSSKQQQHQSSSPSSENGGGGDEDEGEGADEGDHDVDNSEGTPEDLMASFTQLLNSDPAAARKLMLGTSKAGAFNSLILSQIHAHLES